MLNGINNQELLNAQLEQKTAVSGVTNPIGNPYKKIDENLLIDETAISNEAIKLYEKEQDVSKFTQLSMSNPEDTSHEELISKLFNSGVTDVMSDDVLKELAENSDLLNDLAV